MAADWFDIDIDQGSTFVWDITVYDTDGVTPLDLSGYTVRSMLRKRYDDVNPSETFNITYPDAINGKVRLLLSATETAALLKGRYVYDIELEDGTGKVVKIYKGFAVVYPEATK
jgi:hypothetical protein